MPLSHQELRQRAADSRAKAAAEAKALQDAANSAAQQAVAEAKALLDAANSASQTVAVLHVAFMAVCAYVLVIVFGTTDLDLLMGSNNIKLPVIDVAVPIVGFYAVAPYLVVLMHLNLLLQLQLLSRKLFAFAAATPTDEGIDAYTARGILRQIQPIHDSDSTGAGLATVLLALMKANEPCPGLAGLSAENKAGLESRAKQEAEREQAANTARAGQR